MDSFLNLINNFSIIDYIFLLFLIFFSFLGLNKGFVLSLLSFLKWIFAFILVKILLPIITPYTESIFQSEFTHDVVVGTIIFILSIFLIMLIMKGMKKTMSWTGLGPIDKFFGFIFGFFKGYAYFIALYSIINFTHPSDRWSNSFNKGKFMTFIISGQNFLEENLPKRYEYIDKSKKNVEKITK
jgi:membrane protein required for colicin V production